MAKLPKSHPMSAHKTKFAQVMHKWKRGTLHSGRARGPVVRSQKQALAIAFSESGSRRRRR